MAPTDPFDFSDFGGAVPEVPASRSFAGSAPAQSRPAGGGPDPFTGSFDPFADQPPARQPGYDGAFGDAGGVPVQALTVAGPPVGLFASAFLTALAGVAVGAVAASRGSTVLLAFAGWLLAGPAAIGALAWFNGVDTHRRLSSVYSAPTWLHTAYWAVLATCAVGIGLGAWQIALWAGRQ